MSYPDTRKEHIIHWMARHRPHWWLPFTFIVGISTAAYNWQGWLACVAVSVAFFAWVVSD